MRRIVQLFSYVGWVAVVSSTAFSADLIDVYNQSLKSDPQFKEAEAQWLSAKTALPLAEAAMLPQVDIVGAAMRKYNRIDSSGVLQSAGWSNNYNLGLNVNQAVFNYSAWMSINEASASVKAATAGYLFNTQALMARVSAAYFAVLQANQTLRYTLSEEKTLYQTLQQQQQEYKVGLIAVTGVYNAQSQYDTVVAEEIADRNRLSDTLENLRAITGIYYNSLAGLMSQVPLSHPDPYDINAWVDIAAQHNYNILAQKYTVVASRENVKVQAAGNFPVLSLGGNFLRNSNQGAPEVDSSAGAFGANLNFPIFQGGATQANTDKARYDFLNASAVLEQTYRDTLNQTRQSYLNVTSLIYKINADLQSIRSKQNNLAATQAGYKVGTRTMVDVLQAIQQLTESQKDFANDQYDYIMNIISLKEQAGTLSVADLQKINQWLTQTQIFDTTITNKISPINVNVNASATTFTNSSTGSPYQTINPVVPNLPNPTPVTPPPAAPKTVTPVPTEPEKNIPAPSFENATTAPSTLPEPFTTPTQAPATSAPATAAPVKTSTTVKTPNNDNSPVFSTDPNAAAANNISNAHYSLQLYAAPTLTKAQHFIKEHNLKNIALSTLNKNGKLWYEVLLGDYNSYNQAKLARAKLSPALQSAWIKQV